MIDSSGLLDKKNSKRVSPLILVADDNKDNIDLIEFIVKALNLKCIVAYDGQTAFDLAKDKLPDLILLDIVMPEINGIEVGKFIKRCLLTNHIPIVAVTGLTNPEHISQIEDAGFDDYLVKPFMIEDLESKLKHFLQIS